MAKNKKKTKKNKRTSLAETADIHKLYEYSVQYAESEVDFLEDTFKAIRGRRAQLLREDFCGTANVCCEWVKRRKTHRAIGVDIDEGVLAWGRDNNLAGLSHAQWERVELIQSNVLDVTTESPDIISAMNFSYWLFKDRGQLVSYFRSVREALADDGVMFLDAYGGYDSFRDIVEEREIEEGGGFTYIWEQESFDPISNGLLCHIHFAFPDGSRLDKAFSYDWRLWTLPEVRELLETAGFTRVTFYWQGWDENEEPDGIFKPVTEGVADAGWICYITAEK